MDKIFFSKENLDNPDETAIFFQRVADTINEIIDKIEERND